MSPRFLLALALAGAVPLVAHAGPFPTPGAGTFMIGAGGSVPFPTDPAVPFAPTGETVSAGNYGLDCSSSPCTPITGSIFTVNGTPAPVASVQLTGGETPSNAGFAYVTYQYTVVGLAPGATTPGQIVLNMQTSYSDPQDLESAFAEVRLDGTTTFVACSGITQCYYVAGLTFSYASSIVGPQAVTLQQSGKIELLADVGISFLPSANGYALADPVLLADNGDQIVLSDGFANATAAVPEPGSVLLLAAGAAVMARLRRPSAPAA